MTGLPIRTARLSPARLRELETAAVNALDETRAGHPDTVLQIRADEMLALCRAARWAALSGAALSKEKTGHAKAI